MDKTIAIAKAFGWVKVWRNINGKETQIWVDGNQYALTDYELPRYFNDLNVIREAKLKLDAKQKMVFGDILNEIVQAFYHDYYDGMVGNNGSFSEAIFDISNATAQQQGEALYRTISK